MSVVIVVCCQVEVCDELITRPEESYRLWCVVVCDLETSRMRRPWPALGRSATGKNKFLFLCTVSYCNSAVRIPDAVAVTLGSNRQIQNC